MSGWDEANYRQFFRHLNGGCEPYGFQVDVARRLVAGESLTLRAPTGSGKTATVLTPFLYSGWCPRPARLIYALPLRTLAQSIYRAARHMAGCAGHDPDEVVTIQTGEQPEDPFLDLGKIVVTTYDQVLSGLLDGPYGLPSRLHNVNAAALAGALLVFDEFHLMEPQRAFLTGAAGLYLFRELTQSVWMTATATPPLVRELAKAIGAGAAGPSEAEVAELPTVKTVTRKLVWEARPLAGDELRLSSSGRTIIIANTVARAQALFKTLAERYPDIPSVLLHSRFFRNDRREKEALLARLFGKGTRGPALLVATQVVEAGVDISCDDLHTELAPMNSLMQRAGRCARYEGEAGTVHVHPLPDEPRAWLPYGNLREPDPILAATERLLEEARGAGVALNPVLAAKWVSEVHADADGRALVGGWRGQLGQIRTLIRQSAIDRRPSRVTDLIREPDTDDVAVLLADESSLPLRPADREVLTLSRWRVAGLVRDLGTPNRPIGWYWEPGEDPGWRPLTDPDQLQVTYAVAVDPAFARYTQEIGLEDGLPGEQISPDQVQPPRPGHKPLRAETWSDHARAVAAHVKRRLSRDGDWLGRAIKRRYGLGLPELMAAASACGLSHDLGKLQVDWQEWARQSQEAIIPGYQHVAPLAHTDFDPSDPRERDRERLVGVRRPDHSTASAFLSAGLLGKLLDQVPPGLRTRLASACAAAILAHHGGWLQADAAGRRDLGIQPLWSGSGESLDDVFGSDTATRMARLMAADERRQMLRTLLDKTMGDEAFLEWWPLVAYLTRALRLADQRATAEGG